MSHMPIDPLESILRQAMTARPQPVPAVNLARAAMQIAQTDVAPGAQMLALLSRVRRRNRMLGFVAALLVLVILIVGGLRLASQSNQASAYLESVQSSSTSTGSQSELSRPGVLLTGEALAAALILLSLGGPLLTRQGPGVSDLVFH